MSGAKLRVATYNVHGCMGMDRQRSEARIAEVIAEMSVDIVALQELDFGRRRSAGADQTKMIAEQLGWYSHFHPAMRRDDEHYGNAILSRYQLNFRRGIELPGRPPFFCRENRAAIEVNIETNLGKVHIINTHLGLGWRERFVQAQLFTSAEWRAAIAGDTPLILLGDFNSLRGSRPYRTLNRASARCARTHSSDGTNSHLPDAISGAGCRSYFRQPGGPATKRNRTSLTSRANCFRSFSAYG